ncbi:zinc-binding dehydrogenase [Microbacterium sp.]|uniref:zinc-binding dehydrogenase n=1 Tax=Microbacterium sp. TaxID=51671 RepID=UPI003C71BAC5
MTSVTGGPEVAAADGSAPATPAAPARTLQRFSPAPEALVFRGADEGFELIAVPDVTLREGELLVRVELATVCGSDRHTVSGARIEQTPLVLGHEQVGRIAAVGPGIPPRTVDDRPLAIGDRVVWGVVVPCRDCRLCRRGLPNKCRNLRKYGHSRMTRGWELSGGFATHVHVVAGTDVVRVPDDLPAEMLAPASCATATVVAAIDAAARPVNGEIVVVSGCGMLGLTAVAMAREAGATVVGIDPDPQRRERAIRFGAATVAEPGDSALRAAIRRAAVHREAKAGREVGPGREDDPEGFAVGLELSGASTAIDSLIATADIGAVIVLAGSVFPAPPVPVLAEEVVRRILTLTGVHNYRGEHLVRAVAFLRRADRTLFASLVADAVALPELPQALTAPANGTRLGIRS